MKKRPAGASLPTGRDEIGDLAGPDPSEGELWGSPCHQDKDDSISPFLLSQTPASPQKHKSGESLVCGMGWLRISPVTLHANVQETTPSRHPGAQGRTGNGEVTQGEPAGAYALRPRLGAQRSDRRPRGVQTEYNAMSA